MPEEQDKPDHLQPEGAAAETKTPPMEVHHHPDLHHKRKHFREYLLEFLMIF